MTVNPHAPSLNWTARVLGRFHVTGVFWYKFPFFGAKLPLWTEVISVNFFTLFFLVALGRIRSAIAANLEPVLGPANLVTRWRRAYRTMKSFAWGMQERYRLFLKPSILQSTSEGLELWNEVMQQGSGVILISAHVGSWDISPRLGAEVAQRRIHVIREKEIDPRAQQFMRELIEGSSQQLVTHYLGEDATLSLELAEALKAGEIVAFQADRPHVGGRSVTATIFGMPMPLPVGPAALARATGAPMLPVFNFREGRYKSHIVVRPAIRAARTTNREKDISDAMHRVAAEIEYAIRREPHQWFCFRKLW